VALGIKRFVFSSTAATYAFDNEMPLRETSAVVPEVPYGRSKLAAEWLLRDYARAYGLGCVMFRYFNAAGADPDGEHGECRRHEGHIIPRILQVAVGRRKSFTVFGTDYATRDGTCVRDYVHTADLAQAHQLAVEQVKPGDQRVYNLGSGTGATVLEILRACEKACGRKIRHEMGPRRPGDPGVLIADPGAAVRELGWKPRNSEVDQVVETAWRWHRDHPDGYPGGDN
jgi:UDP-glucose 4-epimerase